MSDESDEPIDVEGMALDEAVEEVTAAADDRDRETVRRRLRRVAGDGVVKRGPLERFVESVDVTVSMMTGRVDAVEGDISDARAAAEPVADVPVVAARLDEFDARYADLEERAAELPDRMAAAREVTDEGGIYEAVATLERLKRRAVELQQDADALRGDVNVFRRWADEPDARYGECEQDLDALADVLSRIEDEVDAIADADETGAADDGAAGDAASEGGASADETGAADDGASADETDAASEGGADAGVAWADAMMRTRIVGLFLTDVRTDVAALRTWARRTDLDEEPAAALAEHVDDLDDRRGALADRLGELERADWRSRFGDVLDDLSADLDRFEPPVDWPAVQETLTEYRAGIGALDR